MTACRIINNYPAKSRGISPDRRYSARLSRIIVNLFNIWIDNKTNNFIRPGKKLFYLQLSLLRRTKLRILQDICYLELQILRESWPNLDSVTICWMIIKIISSVRLWYLQYSRVKMLVLQVWVGFNRDDLNQATDQLSVWCSSCLFKGWIMPPTIEISIQWTSVDKTNYAIH